jgi:hypothetical protein
MIRAEFFVPFFLRVLREIRAHFFFSFPLSLPSSPVLRSITGLETLILLYCGGDVSAVSSDFWSFWLRLSCAASSRLCVDIRSSWG